MTVKSVCRKATEISYFLEAARVITVPDRLSGGCPDPGIQGSPGKCVHEAMTQAKPSTGLAT